MLSDGKALVTLHSRWIAATVIVTVGAIACYGMASLGGARWPGGSSLVGLTFGVLATAIIGFECLLVLRRTPLLRTFRYWGSAQFWMKAHIWLGIVAVPLVLMHSGFHWGSWLSTSVASCFALVTVSGLFGLVMQTFIPRKMLEWLPEETIHSQIDEIAQQLAADARRMVGLMDESPRLTPPVHKQAAQFVVSGFPRRVGTMVERNPRPKHELPQEVVSPPALQEALVQDIEPFLLSGKSPQQRLHSPQRCAWYFEELRRRIDVPESQLVVDALERLCERRRQMNLQRTLHFWLQGWLHVHLPLAMALLILLAGHILFALRYS